MAFKKTRERITCSKCKKNFTLVTLRYPTYLEEREWDTFYACPYCKNATRIRLNGDEDVRTEKEN